MREIKIGPRTYKAERLTNGLLRVVHPYSGLTCCLNSDGTPRHGDLRLTAGERLIIKTMLDK